MFVTLVPGTMCQEQWRCNIATNNKSMTTERGQGAESRWIQVALWMTPTRVFSWFLWERFCSVYIYSTFGKTWCNKPLVFCFFFQVEKSWIVVLQNEGKNDNYDTLRRCFLQVLMDESFGITCHWGWGPQETCWLLVKEVHAKIQYVTFKSSFGGGKFPWKSTCRGFLLNFYANVNMSRQKFVGSQYFWI